MAQYVSWLNLALELITSLSLGQQFWGSKIMMHNKSILVGSFTSPTYDKLPPYVNPQGHNFWQLIKRNQPAFPAPNLAQLFEVPFGNSKKDVSHKANLSHHKKQTNKQWWNGDCLRGRLGKRVTAQISGPRELEANKKNRMNPDVRPQGWWAVKLWWSPRSPRAHRLPTPEGQPGTTLLSDREQQGNLGAAALSRRAMTTMSPYQGSDGQGWGHLPRLAVCTSSDGGNMVTYLWGFNYISSSLL